MHDILPLLDLFSYTNEDSPLLESSNIQASFDCDIFCESFENLFRFLHLCIKSKKKFSRFPTKWRKKMSNAEKQIITYIACLHKIYSEGVIYSSYSSFYYRNIKSRDTLLHLQVFYIQLNRYKLNICYNDNSIDTCLDFVRKIFFFCSSPPHTFVVH